MINNLIEFEGATVGMLLGDASITKHKENTNSYFSICHCQDHVEYMLYKRRILDYLTPSRFYENQPNGTCGKYFRCRLDTRSHPFYTEMRDTYYPSGKKIITSHMLNVLSPLGLALWYQDDGYLSDHENFSEPGLCTHGFTKAENEMISKALLEKFGLDWRLRKDNRKGYRDYYRLSLIRKDRERFFELVSPFIVDCMRYKITPEIDTSAVRLNEKLQFQCEICGKEFQKDYRQRFEANRFCGHECYWKSKKTLKGTQVIPLENGRFINEYGQYVKTPVKKKTKKLN